MILRIRNLEVSTEYGVKNGILEKTKEVYNKRDYNKLFEGKFNGNILECIESIQDMDELENFCVKEIKNNLKIQVDEGFIALMLCFRPFDMNLLEKYDLEYILSKKVSRNHYRGILNRLLGVEIYTDFNSDIDKTCAITAVEAAHYILENFEGVLEESSIVPTILDVYDIPDSLSIVMQNQENLETNISEYIDGSISAYNIALLCEEGTDIIYPYIRSMAEILFQELVFENILTGDLIKDMLYEMTYRDLFYMIYRMLVYTPECEE